MTALDLRDPKDYLRAKIAREAELGRGRLREFTRLAWDQVEPHPLRGLYRQTRRNAWHMDAICEHLEAVTSGQIRELVICVPPGTSKSLIVSTMWPSWVWARNATKQFMCATYAQELSDKNAELHRNLILSPWYQARWGGTGATIRRGDVARVRNFKNEAKGWRISTSVLGRATGIHADIHIGDDLAKAQDAQGRAYVDPVAIEKANTFWFETMATRRADAASLTRVMVAQRLHHDDTPGKCIDRGYTALVLPMEYDPTRPCKTTVWWTAPGATEPSRFEDPRTDKGELLAPERFPQEVVDKDKITLGPITHEAQNQQNPTPRDGAIFKDIGRNRWKVLPTANIVTLITVDCSFKETKSSDFVAVQVWIRCGTQFYLAERHLERLGIKGTILKILDVKARWPRASIRVEDKANGPAVIEMLTGEVAGLQAWSPGQDSKVGRAEAVAHLFDSNNVWLPPDDQAPWVGEYLATMGRFPLVKNDDDVDATTMALIILYQPHASQYADMVKAMMGR